MARGLFVTGTDTSVGKTTVAAALMHRYRGRVPLRYWKPIQTGIENDDDTATVASLGGCRDDEIERDGVRLPRPVSPHLAARWQGVTIDLEPLSAVLRRTAHDAAWIVEGAGGVLVPINERETMADLIAATGLAAVVASRTALGTINHTLLTLEALRHRGITVAGVVLVGPRDDDARSAIADYGTIAILGDMPHFAPLTTAALVGWAPALDSQGHLLRWLK
jgi:dethiobiotin synthase